MALGSTWVAMLAITVWTHADHVLIAPAWGIIVAVLGAGVLIDRDQVFHAYRRGMPAGVSVAYVRGVVVVTGVILVAIGILVTTLGCIGIWSELWPGR